MFGVLQGLLLAPTVFLVSATRYTPTGRYTDNFENYDDGRPYVPRSRGAESPMFIESGWNEQPPQMEYSQSYGQRTPWINNPGEQETITSRNKPYSYGEGNGGSTTYGGRSSGFPMFRDSGRSVISPQTTYSVRPLTQNSRQDSFSENWGNTDGNGEARVVRSGAGGFSGYGGGGREIPSLQRRFSFGESSPPPWSSNLRTTSKRYDDGTVYGDGSGVDRLAQIQRRQYDTESDPRYTTTSRYQPNWERSGPSDIAKKYGLSSLPQGAIIIKSPTRGYSTTETDYPREEVTYIGSEPSTLTGSQQVQGVNIDAILKMFPGLSGRLNVLNQQSFPSSGGGGYLPAVSEVRPRQEASQVFKFPSRGSQGTPYENRYQSGKGENDGVDTLNQLRNQVDSLTDKLVALSKEQVGPGAYSGTARQSSGSGWNEPEAPRIESPRRNTYQQEEKIGSSTPTEGSTYTPGHLKQQDPSKDAVGQVSGDNRDMPSFLTGGSGSPPSETTDGQASRIVPRRFSNGMSSSQMVGNSPSPQRIDTRSDSPKIDENESANPRINRQMESPSYGRVDEMSPPTRTNGDFGSSTNMDNKDYSRPQGGSKTQSSYPKIANGGNTLSSASSNPFSTWSSDGGPSSSMYNSPPARTNNEENHFEKMFSNPDTRQNNDDNPISNKFSKPDPEKGNGGYSAPNTIARPGPKEDEERIPSRTTEDVGVGSLFGGGGGNDRSSTSSNNGGEEGFNVGLNPQHPIRAHPRSVMISLEDRMGEFYGRIYVGTPPQELFALFDTGSPFLWVVSKEACQSVPCSSEINPFDGKRSSSYSSSTLPFKSKFAAGSLVNGIQAKDLVQLGDTGEQYILEKQVFGSAMSFNELFGEHEAVFGLDILEPHLHKGDPDPPLVTLSKQYGSVPMFSYYINKFQPTQSKLMFGFPDESTILSDFTTHAVVPTIVESPSGKKREMVVNGWNINIHGLFIQKPGQEAMQINVQGMTAHPDSGTQSIAGPEDLIEQIHQSIFQHASFQYNPKTYKFPCPGLMYNVYYHELPDVVFVIDNEKFVLTPYDYIGKGPGEVCISRFRGLPGFKYVILGRLFMTKFVTRYDHNKREVGFAKARQMQDGDAGVAEIRKIPAQVIQRHAQEFRQQVAAGSYDLNK